MTDIELKAKIRDYFIYLKYRKIRIYQTVISSSIKK